MNNYYFSMATQHSQMTDRKRTRTDILTTSLDSAPICSWPRFLLIKGTDNERPLSKLSPFAVNKAIVAVLGSDPFNIKKLRNGEILIEVDKEAQSSKLLKTAKLNLIMDNVIPITVSPHYSLNTKKGVIRCPDIKELKDEGVIKLDRISIFRDGQRKPTGIFILTSKARPCQNTSGWVTTGWLCRNSSQIPSDAISVKSLVTLNLIVGKMKFAIIVGKKIIQTLKNARTKRNV